MGSFTSEYDKFFGDFDEMQVILGLAKLFSPFEVTLMAYI